MVGTNAGLKRGSDGERLAVLEMQYAYVVAALERLEKANADSLARLERSNEGQSRHLSAIQAKLDETKGGYRVVMVIGGIGVTVIGLLSGLIGWVLDHLPRFIK